MRRTELYARFAFISALCLVVAIFGFDVAARVLVGHRPLRDAVSQSVDAMVNGPILTFFLIVPFVALTVLASEVGKAATVRVAAAYFATFATLLGFIYFSGYWGAQTALEDRAWTAASLSVALGIPFWSVIVISVAAASCAFIERKYRRET